MSSDTEFEELVRSCLSDGLSHHLGGDKTPPSDFIDMSQIRDAVPEPPTPKPWEPPPMWKGKSIYRPGAYTYSYMAELEEVDGLEVFTNPREAKSAQLRRDLAAMKARTPGDIRERAGLPPIKPIRIPPPGRMIRS